MDGFVNAIPITCFERARQRAMALMADAHRAEDHAHPPGFLYGLPILVKDDQAVSGVQWCKGFYRDRVPKESDPLVLRLVSHNGNIVPYKF